MMAPPAIPMPIIGTYTRTINAVGRLSPKPSKAPIAIGCKPILIFGIIKQT